MARLEDLAPRFTLINQNVDGLHRRVGGRGVFELHGTSPGRAAPAKALGRKPGSSLRRAPRRPGVRCAGAYLRPDVVWFGEPLPEDALRRAWASVYDCDLFLTVGTSNLIEPAASLPWLAADRGAIVVVVNTTMKGQPKGPSIHQLTGAAGQVLPRLIHAACPP